MSPTDIDLPLPGNAPGLPSAPPIGRLRRLRVSDLAAFQAYRALPELGRYQGWTPMPEAEAGEFLREMAAAPLCQPGAWLQLGIASADGSQLLGDIGLHLSEDGRRGELGFTLAPAAQGRGLATAAARAAIGLLWAHSQAQQVLGCTDARNAPSIRLLQRLGFVLQARRDTCFRGEPCCEWDFVLERPR